MAEIVIRELIDDLDKKPIDAGFGFEINFSYRGVDYRIDLRPANADKIGAAFAPFIRAAEKVPWVVDSTHAKTNRAALRLGRPLGRCEPSVNGHARTASGSRIGDE